MFEFLYRFQQPISHRREVFLSILVSVAATYIKQTEIYIKFDGSAYQNYCEIDERVFSFLKFNANNMRLALVLF